MGRERGPFSLSARHQGRELAVKILYQADVAGTSPHEEQIAYFAAEEGAVPGAQSFATELVRGVWAHLREIDATIDQHAHHWHVQRLAAVDRNILRVGVYELRYVLDMPPAVAIDEAVELAKVYGDDDASPRFVNGILGALVTPLGSHATPAANDGLLTTGQGETQGEPKESP